MAVVSDKYRPLHSDASTSEELSTTRYCATLGRPLFWFGCVTVVQRRSCGAGCVGWGEGENATMASNISG